MQPACDGRQTLADGHSAHAGRAVETRVDVARACYFKSGETLQRTEGCDDLLRDDLGSLAQFARQFKGDGSGQFAESQVGRYFNGDGLELEIVLCLQDAAKVCREPILQFQIHVDLPLKSLIFKGNLISSIWIELVGWRPRKVRGSHPCRDETASGMGHLGAVWAPMAKRYPHLNAVRLKQ